MARFESRWQVFGFLLGAALVSLAVIEVLKVEAARRYGDDDAAEDVLEGDLLQADDGQNSRNEATSFVSALKSHLSNRWENLKAFFGHHEPQTRRRRSIPDPDDPTPTNFDVNGNDDDSGLSPEVNEARPGEGPEISADPPEVFIKTAVTHPVDDLYLSQDFQPLLSEALINEEINSRKIRNMKNKIAHLPIEDPLVQAVLERFCQPDMEQEVSPDEENHFYSFDGNSEKFPQLSNQDDEKESFEFYESKTSFQCTSYGDLYLTVCLTSVINFSLIGLVLLGQALLRARRRNRRNIDFFSNNFNEHFGKEIFKTRTSEYSPIIKNMSDNYKI